MSDHTYALFSAFVLTVCALGFIGCVPAVVAAVRRGARR